DLARDAERLAQQALAADQPELARLLASAHRRLRDTGVSSQDKLALRAELSEAVAGLGAVAPEAPAPTAPVPPPKPAPQGGTGLEDDPEMRDIFIEEAREVVTDATAAVERLLTAPDSAQDMTAVRRAFHTLKGSSRMVGLRDFGEAAWACEQLFNARLAQAPHMDPPLRLCTTEALAYMSSWVEAIAAGHEGGHQTAAVAQSADALRLEDRRVPIELPAPVAPAAVAEVPVPEDSTLILPRPTAAAAETAVSLDRTVRLEDGPTVILPKALPAEAAPEAEAEAELDLEALPVAELLPEQPVEAIEEFTVSTFDAPAIEAELPAPPDVPAIEVPAEAVEPFAATLIEDPSHDPLGEAQEPAVPEAAFMLSLGDLDDEPAPRVVPDVQPLAQRMPDLPSAADLDLAAPAPAALASVPTPVDEDLSFELDLGEFNEVPERAAAESALPMPVDLPLDAPDLLLEGEAGDTAAVPAADVESVEIDFDEFGDVFADAPVEAAPAAAAAVAEPAAPETVPEPPTDPTEADEQVKVIGPLRISIPLFNIYLNEADELSRRLVAELGEWTLEAERHPVADSAVALAHSLAGSSATVGYAELSALARSLEHALMRSSAAGHGRPGEAQLFADVAEEIRRLLHQFAAGFLRPVDEALTEQLAAHERLPVQSA
ncbi:MAG: Hpt domain-containing protein, partial [Rubrivivax sp.]|nr:Hpt domain-containing protein [Rubrivivax sp.]